MKKAYIVLGMKRSGHHAIAYWIAHNLNGKTVLWNDCCKGWSQGKLIPNHIQPGQSQTQEVGSGKHNTDIYNIEDFNTDWLKKVNFRNFESLKRYDELHIMMVLRDPYNWIASSLRCGGGPARRIVGRIALWKRQARFCLDKEGYGTDKILRVSYNDWFQSEEYRAALADCLHLNSYDKGINLTSPRGGGSSFDKMRFKRKAQEMKVLERYKYFQGNPEYEKFTKDAELLELSEKMFGVSYGNNP